MNKSIGTKVTQKKNKQRKHKEVRKKEKTVEWVFGRHHEGEKKEDYCLGTEKNTLLDERKKRNHNDFRFLFPMKRSEGSSVRWLPLNDNADNTEKRWSG